MVEGRDYTLPHLPASSFYDVIRKQSMVNGTECVSQTTSNKCQNVEAGKALPCFHNVHAFLPCLYCIEISFCQRLCLKCKMHFPLFCWIFYSAEGQTKTTSFLQGGIVPYSAKGSPPWVPLRSTSQMVVPSSRPAIKRIQELKASSFANVRRMENRISFLVFFLFGKWRNQENVEHLGIFF